MTWKEFESNSFDNDWDWYRSRVQTEIECPRCGKKIYKRMDIVLASYPPQYRYECDCGWAGSAYK